MLVTQHKQTIDRWVRPLAHALARAGISPSALTITTVVLSAIVCGFLLLTRAIVPFCVTILAVGLLDGLDGAVARVSGRVTRFGAYLDAVCDRYVDAMVVLSVAAVTGYWLWSMLVLVGALLVSYTKARAAMEVSVANLEWPDLMERTERSLCFLGGLAAGALIPWHPLGHDLFWWTLVILAVLIHLTVVQRILRAKRFILERSSSSPTRR